MGKFVIGPHMRLHEWVAQEKGYFESEGLDYELKDQLSGMQKGNLHDLGEKVGAYQTFEEGRSSDVSCACHWTVNVAAASGHGKLFADAYSVSPCGIFVPPESPIKSPEELANVPTVCGSLREALESLDADRDFLKKGDVMNDDMIDAYLHLKWEEVYALEHTTHPIEFSLYYSA